MASPEASVDARVTSGGSPRRRLASISTENSQSRQVGSQHTHRQVVDDRGQLQRAARRERLQRERLPRRAESFRWNPRPRRGARAEFALEDGAVTRREDVWRLALTAVMVPVLGVGAGVPAVVVARGQRPLARSCALSYWPTIRTVPPTGRSLADCCSASSWATRDRDWSERPGWHTPVPCGMTYIVPA